MSAEEMKRQGVQRAPFPAILYCLAVIDLLGALLSGDASRNSNTTQNAKQYMETYMKYGEEQAALLQQVFRHKLVHLAQPKFVKEYEGDMVAWALIHPSDRSRHLKKVPKFGSIPHIDGFRIQYDHLFCVSITDLVKDIEDSV